MTDEPIAPRITTSFSCSIENAGYVDEYRSPAASPDYQRGFRDGLERARQLALEYQQPMSGEVVQRYRNMAAKRIAHKIYVARKELITDA